MAGWQYGRAVIAGAFLLLGAASLSAQSEQTLEPTTETTPPAAMLQDEPIPAAEPTEAAAEAETTEPFVFGVILIGTAADRGWSQAQYEAGQFIEETVPGAHMLLSESLNSADRPDATMQSEVSAMVAQGARLIFTTSDEFQADTNQVAVEFPDVTFVNITGDTVLTGQAPPNVSNFNAQMEWTQMIAGCAAGLMTESGQIAYLGPLINPETRRMASSSFLGARYCYTHYRGGDAADLTYTVTWIGFWFNIPGITLDPAQVTNDLFDSGTDVVISGIDTTEALQVAGQRHADGELRYAIPFDYQYACEEAPDACLGVPFYRWGVAYAGIVEQVRAETWHQQWVWASPDWDDLTGEESVVSYEMGAGLNTSAEANLRDFMADMAAYAVNPFVPQSFVLWSGPLALQDGTLLAEAGQTVNILDVWYLPQLLENMIGASN